MRAAMLISVVIPVRDRLPLLERTLGSLRLQSYRHFEVIIVDDGSKEDVGEVVARFPDLTIRLLRSGGRGANRARNMGTDAAAGSFIAYLDSDDLFLPDKLLRAAARLEAEDPDILISAGYVWRGSDRLQIKPRRPIEAAEDISEFYFVQDERFITSAFVVKASAAREVRWDEALNKVQDPDFMIRLVRSGRRITYLEEPLVVLCDDVQTGRISHANHAANMQDWLNRSGHLLTSRARASFEMYVMAYEIARRDRISGMRFASKHILSSKVPPRLILKSFYRIMVPVSLFKITAQARLLFQRRSRTSTARSLIESIAWQSEGRGGQRAPIGYDQTADDAALLRAGSS
jgi:glycosyltransferase involved in cell wall biosynthesis